MENRAGFSDARRGEKSCKHGRGEKMPTGGLLFVCGRRGWSGEMRGGPGSGRMGGERSVQKEGGRGGGEMSERRRRRRGGNLWAVGRGWRATTTRPTTRASGLPQFTVSPAADGRRASGRSGAKARDSSERLEQRHIAALAWAMATPSASLSGVLICPRALPQRATGRLAGGQQAGRQVVFSLVAYDGVLSAAPQRRQGPWYESMEVSTSC